MHRRRLGPGAGKLNLQQGMCMGPAAHCPVLPVACCARLPAWLPVSGVTWQLIIILRLTIFHLPEKQEDRQKNEREERERGEERELAWVMLCHLMKERASTACLLKCAFNNGSILKLHFFVRLVKEKVTANWLYILQWHLARNYWEHSDCCADSLFLSSPSFFPSHSNWPRQTTTTYEAHIESGLESRRVNNDGHVLQNVLLVCESTFFSLHFVHTIAHTLRIRHVVQVE